MNDINDTVAAVIYEEKLLDKLADTIYAAMPWEGETYQAAAESIANAVLPVIKQVVTEQQTELLHPEFGTVYDEDGAATKAREALALEVAAFWTRNNGWIPGGAKRQLESVLGLRLPSPRRTQWSEDGHSVVDNPRAPKDCLRRNETYEEWEARQ